MADSGIRGKQGFVVMPKLSCLIGYVVLLSTWAMASDPPGTPAPEARLDTLNRHLAMQDHRLDGIRWYRNIT
jgi:hypothetical protein